MSCWELKLTEIKCLWFFRALHREAQSSDCPQSAPGGGRTCEDQSEVISKSFASFIYTETLCVSFLLGPYPPCIKRQQNADKLLTCCFLAVLSGCCLFRHTVEWTWPANWTRTKQNESLTKVQKVFTLHDTSLIYIEPVDLNLRVTWGWKSTLKSTNLCTTYKDGSVI